VDHLMFRSSFTMFTSLAPWPQVSVLPFLSRCNYSGETGWLLLALPPASSAAIVNSLSSLSLFAVEET
jgi:hypothetical protein